MTNDERNIEKIAQLKALIEAHTQKSTPKSETIIKRATWLIAWLEHNRSCLAASKTLGVPYHELFRLANSAKARGVIGACEKPTRPKLVFTEDDLAFIKKVIQTNAHVLVRNHAKVLLAYHEGGYQYAIEQTGYSRKIVIELVNKLARESDWRAALTYNARKGRAVMIDLSDHDHAVLDELLAQPVADYQSQVLHAKASALKFISQSKRAISRDELKIRFNLSPNSLSRLLTDVRKEGVERTLKRTVFFGHKPKTQEDADAQPNISTNNDIGFTIDLADHPTDPPTTDTADHASL